MGTLDETIVRIFGAASPQIRRLKFEVVSVDGGVCVGKLPYSPELVGDPSSGVLHGGVVTTLLDTAGGAAVLSKVGKPLPIATLDLRIDYLRPSSPGQSVYARVECYKATYNIAFARGLAYNDDERDPVASMAATYMLRTQSVRGQERT